MHPPGDSGDVNQNDLATIPKRFDSFELSMSPQKNSRPFSPFSTTKSVPDDERKKKPMNSSHSAIQARLNSNYASSTHQIVLEHQESLEKMEPSQPATLMENYYYPCDEVITFERTLIKHSIVWDYAC